MLRHVILWTYKEGFTDAENAENARKVKAELEALVDLIDEVEELRVYINPQPSGNRQVMLESRFADADALERYRVHPEHVRVGKLVHHVLENRACMDFYEN